MFGVPLLSIVGGIGLIVAGFAQAQRDDAAVQVFRADPSCGPNLRRSGNALGNCTVLGAQVVSVYDGSGVGGGSALQSGPSVTLTFDDGTTQVVSLAATGSGTAAFVHGVYPGTAVRVQRYRGAVARVGQGAYAADASGAPEAMVTNDAQLRWVGVFVAVAAFIGLLLAWHLRRRALAGRPY